MAIGSIGCEWREDDESREMTQSGMERKGKLASSLVDEDEAMHSVQHRTRRADD